MCMLTYTTFYLCPHTMYTAAPCSSSERSEADKHAVSFTNTSARMTNEDLYALFKCPERTLLHGSEVKKEGMCAVCEERVDSSFSSSPEKTKSKSTQKKEEKEAAEGNTTGDDGSKEGGKDGKEEKKMGNGVKRERELKPEFYGIHSIYPNTGFPEGDDPNYRG